MSSKWWEAPSREMCSCCAEEAKARGGFQVSSRTGGGVAPLHLQPRPRLSFSPLSRELSPSFTLTVLCDPGHGPFSTDHGVMEWLSQVWVPTEPPWSAPYRWLFNLPGHENDLGLCDKSRLLGSPQTFWIILREAWFSPLAAQWNHPEALWNTHAWVRPPEMVS